MKTRHPFLELLIAYAAIQIALWTSGAIKTVAMATAVVAVVGPVLAERAPASDLGFGSRGLRSSLWIAAAALGLLIITMLIGWRSGTLHGLEEEAVWWRVLAYFPWAFAQQFAAQRFFFRRLETLMGSGPSAVQATALLFSLAHLPNPVLVPATLLAEFLWTLAYRRYQNLYAISIAHALLAVAVTVSVPVAWHHSMRVGIGYLRYRAS